VRDASNDENAGLILGTAYCYVNQYYNCRWEYTKLSTAIAMASLCYTRLLGTVIAVYRSQYSYLKRNAVTKAGFIRERQHK
jgi:hypothetical protein